MSEPATGLSLKCPVCGARFRGSGTCSRCGTDLLPLMRIAAKAWRAREQCRAALRAGDLDSALHWSAVARRLQAVRAPAPRTPDAGRPD